MSEQATETQAEAPPAPAPAAGKTLDDLADEALGRVAAFIGQCVASDTFCGLAIDEQRDDNGQVQSITLVACDKIHGDPIRRVGRAG